MNLSGRKIVLVVTGGIAAYKSADLTSRLRKAGAEVRVVMTRAAREFVAPLTFEALSGHPVYGGVFGEPGSYRMEHIEWARWADLVVVAPASADFIARMAHGMADDAGTTLILAFEGPVAIVPAMNTKMWVHPATQANLEILSRRGVRSIGPGAGPLACGEYGEGRMEEPELVLRELSHWNLEPRRAGGAMNGAEPGPLAGQKVIITAGPTREALDPIRFVSNSSTGKMGAALAARARRLGARVLLIHGPLGVPIPEGVESVPAESAEAMLAAVQRELPGSRVAIFAAAVANYRAPEVQGKKLKGGERVTLELVRTPDIAAWAGAHREAGQLLLGFAAESENLLDYARKKLRNKKLDLIFANPIGEPGVGFTAENNSGVLIDAEGRETRADAMPKDRIADWIWERLLARLPAAAPAAAGAFSLPSSSGGR